MAKLFVTDREGKNHEIEAEEGHTIMEVLRELDDGVEALCGGMCSCATCHVFIELERYEQLKPPQDDELELLEETESYREKRSRLSCQIEITTIVDGMRLTIAPEE